MQKTWQQDQKEFQGRVATTSPFHLPDAASAMQDVVVTGLDYCAGKLGLPGAEASLARVREGDRRALEYVHYHLAQQVADAMGALDANVQSVSLYDAEATPDDRALGEQPESLPIHLLVWVDRKTSALNSLSAALDRALTKNYAEMIGPRRLGHVLDVQVIDGGDVASRRGVAALLNSLYNRPVRLWER